MITIILGLILIAFCVCACLPNVLDWGTFIIQVLKGASPILAALAGIVMISIGITDIQDKREAKKEALEAARAEEEEKSKAEQ